MGGVGRQTLAEFRHQVRLATRGVDPGLQTAYLSIGTSFDDDGVMTDGEQTVAFDVTLFADDREQFTGFGIEISELCRRFWARADQESGWRISTG